MSVDATPLVGALRRRVAASNSTTPESRVLAEVRKWAQGKPDVYLVRVVQAGESGVADFVLCVRGKFVAVEAKAAGKKLRPLQAVHGRRIEHAGGIFIWGDDTVVVPELEKIYEAQTVLA